MKPLPRSFQNKRRNIRSVQGNAESAALPRGGRIARQGAVGVALNSYATCHCQAGRRQKPYQKAPHFTKKKRAFIM